MTGRKRTPDRRPRDVRIGEGLHKDGASNYMLKAGVHGAGSIVPPGSEYSFTTSWPGSWPSDAPPQEGSSRLT